MPTQDWAKRAEDTTKRIENSKQTYDWNKGLLAMLYETGARIGEISDLTVGDIEDRENGK